MALREDGTKSTNTDNWTYVNGTSGYDELSGTAKRDYVRGYGSDDTLAGDAGNDVFILEGSLAANGVDTFVDYKVYSSDLDEQDTIDLSLAFAKGVKINGSNVGDYIRVEDNELLVDRDGLGTGYDFEVWAEFDNNGEDEGGGYIEDGDLVNVRTSNFDGKIVATGDESPWDGIGIALTNSGAYVTDQENEVLLNWATGIDEDGDGIFISIGLDVLGMVAQLFGMTGDVGEFSEPLTSLSGLTATYHSGATSTVLTLGPLVEGAPFVFLGADDGDLPCISFDPNAWAAVMPDGTFDFAGADYIELSGDGFSYTYYILNLTADSPPVVA